MGWSYDFWRGTFYPTKLMQKDLLNYYAKQLNTVEVDGTFYRIPSAKTVMDWKKSTGSDFIFSLKFPRVITHVKMLRDCNEEVGYFLNRVGLLEKKLGPLLLQFPPAFGWDNLSILQKFLEELPTKNRYVVEVRNKTLLNADFFSILRRNKTGLAWVESPLMPANDTLNSDFLYVRWEGDRKKVKGTLGKREVDRRSELDWWAKRLEPFLKNNFKIFGYFSKYFSGDAPADALEFLELLGNR